MSRNSTVFRFLWCLTLAAMLVGACGSSVLAGFSDVGAVSGYARDAVEWAVENRIMLGSNHQIKPKDTATRAEACALLMRYRDYLRK